jgi:hypothetical protein
MPQCSLTAEVGFWLRILILAGLNAAGVDFEEIIRTFNQIGYNGPLSVEWEDSGMDREHGAKEACEFVRKIDFQPSQVAFDAAFDE